MSAKIMTAADARRTGRDFVCILSTLPIEQLLPSKPPVKKNNQRLLASLVRDTLAKADSQDVDDVAACTCLNQFCKTVLVLYDEGLLLSTAPTIVREAFMDSLEIAGEATDLESPEVLV